jgi:hypothetical protein
LERQIKETTVARAVRGETSQQLLKLGLAVELRRSAELEVKVLAVTA